MSDNATIRVRLHRKNSILDGKIAWIVCSNSDGTFKIQLVPLEEGVVVQASVQPTEVEPC